MPLPLIELHQAIQSAIASKRLGQPVFVRYLLHGPPSIDGIVPRLVRTMACVRGWMAQPLDRVHALGSVESGHVTLTLVFRRGATSIVSVAPGTSAGLFVDVFLVGNHGSCHHETGDTLWEEAPTISADAASRSVIERALRSGRPEPLEAEITP
jgi:hypothetical protein